MNPNHNKNNRRCPRDRLLREAATPFRALPEHFAASLRGALQVASSHDCSFTTISLVGGRHFTVGRRSAVVSPITAVCLKTSLDCERNQRPFSEVEAKALPGHLIS
jgi:hypothetical protein